MKSTHFMSVAMVSIMLVTLVTAFKFDGHALYEMGCMKQCGSYFSKCYKYCFVADDAQAPDPEMMLEKRDRACLDTCIERLTTCHHYCARS
ncbi:hypothetical protein DPMN_141021 [Dreissena polymorpha]|uniref:Uncharacterized protein n=1 Tax=Dreissena polymorpha TaxID=45954 RepID=A0A9D4JHX1_DREPO|nr:hypothetical protein DPMN_141021 [Dreissena polymorpha]